MNGTEVFDGSNSSCNVCVDALSDESGFLQDPAYYSYRYRIVGTFFQGIVLIVGVLGNLLVVLVVKRTQNMHTPTNCFLMVRKYHRKTTRDKWTEETILQAISSILRGDIGVRAAAEIFSVPYTTLQNRVQKARVGQAFQTPRENIFKPVGRPSAFSADEEKELCDRLVSLANRGFGLTPVQVRSAAYHYAERKSINAPWGRNTEKLAGKDWFTEFMKRNPQISLRKPEGLSKARAAAMNEEDVKIFYNLYSNLCVEFGFLESPEKIYNVDETGFPMNNKAPKIVCEKVKREVVKLTSVERGENVTVVACFSASGVYIPPFVIFKGVRLREAYKEGLPASAVAEMSDSGYINEDLFLKWLEHFQKHRSPGKCLLILDGHTSHCSMKCLNFCSENAIELLCLPPHTTHVLQPLDRTLFKPLKTFYHQEATAFIHNHPNASITKGDFGKLFTAAWNKAASHGNATKGFQCTGMYPYNPNIIPSHKFLPSVAFRAESSTVSSDVVSTLSTSGTSELNKATSPSPKINMSTSSVASTSSPAFSEIIQTPKKSTCRPNRRNPDRKQQARHLTSEKNIFETAEKMRLKMKKVTEKRDHQDMNKLKRRKLFEVEVNDDSSPGEEREELEDEEDVPCGFCGIKWTQSASRGDWIQCQKCETWYHEICVGAFCRKQFVCGKCV